LLTQEHSVFIPPDILQSALEDPSLRQLVVSKAGYFPEARGHGISRLGIDEHILMYCLAGRGWLESGGQRFEVHSGDLVFCPAGNPHAYQADTLAPWSIRWVHFRGEGADLLLQRLAVSPTNPVLSVGVNSDWVTLLRSCSDSLLGGYSLPLLFQASSSLQSFLAAVWARNLVFSDRDEGGTIRFLLDHLDQNLTLDQLAARAGTSRFHFCRSFHRKTGYPPIEYFLRLKVQRACELLETSPLTVGQISEKLAFNSPYYFSSVFKKFTGLPPTSYRGRHREKG